MIHLSVNLLQRNFAKTGSASFNQIPCNCVITALLSFPVREYLEYALRLRCLVLIPSCAMRITEKLLLFLWTSVISSSLQVSFTIFKNILRICYKPTCFSFGKIGLYLDVYHSGVFFFFKLLYTCIIERETYGTT